MTARSDHFLARVVRHLPTLADDAARRSFLLQQQAGWEMRYEAFILTDGDSEPATNPADPPQAADFLLVIAGLGARRDALPKTERNAQVAEPLRGIINAFSPKVSA